MIDMLCLLSDAERKAFPALSQLTENDIDSIWSHVSAYIERQMTLQKGVHLAGLGTFTFSQQKLDLGNKFVMIQRPIFLLAEKLSHSQGLQQARPLAAATHIPVVQLNFTAVSKESPFDRDAVEGCVRESLLLLLKALASEKNLFFTFQGIGVLCFKNNKVRMKFNRDFINAMDRSGRLLLALSNRPGSSASLMSGRLSRLQRPQTTDFITSTPESGNKADDKDTECIWPAPDQKHAGSAKAFWTRPTIRLTDDALQPHGSKSHQTLQPAKMKAVSPSEELNPKTPMEATDKANVSISPPEGTQRMENSHMNISCSGHTRAGQELCYLCMQRAQRNVPVYLREQRLAEEQAQEMLLLLKEQQKDRLYMEKEQANMDEQREHAKQVAAFNLEVSEAVKKEKVPCPSYHTSFIFLDRPLTPARKIKQQCYKDELQAQVLSRKQHDAQDQQNRLLLDYVDQVQLVQEIASQKEEHLQRKQEKTKFYKRALDTQVEAGPRSKEDRRVRLPPIQEKIRHSRNTVQVEDRKGTGLPERQPITSGFGRCETPVINAEGRERAQKLFQEQLITTAEKKREELDNRQAQQTKEIEMLNRNRRDLILDRITRFERRRNMRASLEDTWSRNVKVKHHREDEEKRFLRSGGQLLIDQCEQYRHCYQCKRKPSNHGASNIWKDSRYVPGSRLMI